MRALTYISIAVLICFIFYGLEQRKKAEFYELQGQTMGTFYHIKIRCQTKIDQKKLSQKIKQELRKINQQMSVFIPDSEINQINSTQKNKEIKLSPEMHLVLQTAQRINKETQGAFDPTIEPLIELWGFGKNRHKKIPSSTEIKQAKEHSGFEKLYINTQANSLIKKQDEITLNLSAIAKGYGVDRLAACLKAEGINNFIVEIGGEVKTSGTKTPQGQDWNIAIESPIEKIILNLKDNAVATSGNYHNFYEKNGQKYGHTLSPQTGYPVNNELVSATVVAPSCMEADAYATAFMVMGEKKALDFAKQHNLAVILLSRKSENEMEYIISPQAQKVIKGQRYE